MHLKIKPILALLAIMTLLAATGCGNQSAETAGTQPGVKGAGEDARGDADSGGQAPGDPLHPVVLIQTSLGNITVELDAEKSPLTVDNFLSYVDSGHYDNTIVHQVLNEIPKVVIAGAYTPELEEKKAQTPIRNEARNGLKNVRGTIAMARQPDAVDSATCHFFFNLADNDVLDHKDSTLDGYGYCVFGKVIEGMDVVDRIGAVDVHDTDEFARIPVQTVSIKSIRRVR
jgi:cyclophilin family peptidyl-prolyl cis-trans isomerase